MNDDTRLEALAFASDALSLAIAADDCLTDPAVPAIHASWLAGSPLTYSGCFVRLGGADGPRFNGGCRLMDDIDAARDHFGETESATVCGCVQQYVDELTGFVADFITATAMDTDDE